MDYEALKHSVFSKLARMIECKETLRGHYATLSYNIHKIIYGEEI